MAKTKTSRAKGSTGANDVTALEDFIKSHVERRCLRGGLDQETCDLCLKELDAETLKAVAEECGWREAPARGAEAERGDDTDSEEGQERPQPRGVGAIGDGSILKLLWQNREQVKKIIETLVGLFLLREGGQTAGEDGSTRSAGAQDGENT